MSVIFVQWLNGGSVIPMQDINEYCKAYFDVKINEPSLEERKKVFRRLVQKLSLIGNSDIVIEFRVNGEVKSEYDLSYWTEPDMKSPTDWLNSCFFFYGIKKFGEGELNVTIKSK